MLTPDLQVGDVRDVRGGGQAEAARAEPLDASADPDGLGVGGTRVDQQHHGPADQHDRVVRDYRQLAADRVGQRALDQTTGRRPQAKAAHGVERDLTKTVVRGGGRVVAGVAEVFVGFVVTLDHQLGRGRAPAHGRTNHHAAQAGCNESKIKRRYRKSVIHAKRIVFNRYWWTTHNLVQF